MIDVDKKVEDWLKAGPLVKRFYESKDGIRTVVRFNILEVEDISDLDAAMETRGFRPVTKHE